MNRSLKRTLKALGIAVIGIFRKVRISRGGRVSVVTRRTTIPTWRTEPGKMLLLALGRCFYDTGFTRKGRVFLRLRDNRQERTIMKKIKRRFTSA
jgi:hypothetical protein